MANAHKRYNIDQLMISGELSQDPGTIEGEIVEYYRKLYFETTSWRPTYLFPVPD